MTITQYIANNKKLVDRALNKYLPSSKTKPQIIHRAMRYSVFPGGKRIRPVLTIAGFEACGGTAGPIMPVACAIEIIHTYTLIHDDLPCMDDDDMRRGKPSCHKKFGENIALLAGDALLTLAFQILSKTGKSNLISEVSKAVGSCGTIGGQVVDILRQEKSSRRQLAGGSWQKRNLDYIAKNKTAALFEIAVKSGGMFKGVNRREIDALGNFGKDIGFMFQLVDDLMDKDGYVRVYGVDYVRKRAEFLTRRAKAGLDIFGDKASRLNEITDAILNRKN